MPMKNLDSDLSEDTAKKQFGELISGMTEEANRLRELVESRKISVPEYKRIMWERLGISPYCLVEGVSYILKPEGVPT
jgi:hypothetical protein